MDEAVAIVDAFLRGETVTQRGAGLPGRRRRARPAAGPAAAAADLDGRVPSGRDPAGGALGRLDRGERRGRRRVARDAACGLAERVELARATARREAGLDGRPFDVAVFGQAGLGGFTPADYEAAGATWWLESVTPQRGSTDDILAIAAAGPPR